MRRGGRAPNPARRRRNHRAGVTCSCHINFTLYAALREERRSAE